MDDIRKAMQNVPEVEGDDQDIGITVSRGGSGGGVEAAIRAATGLNIPQGVLDQASGDGGIQMTRPTAKAPAADDETPAETGKGMEVLTPDEAAQLLRNATPQRVDVEREGTEAMAKHMDELAEQHDKDLTSMVEDAVAEEEARLKRHEKALEDPEQVEKIFQGAVPGAPGGTAIYTPPIEGDGTTPPPEAEGGALTQKTSRVDMSMEINTQVNAGLEDLVPTYTDDKDAEKDSTPSADPEELTEKKHRPSPKDGEEEYAAFVRTLPVVMSESDNDSVVNTVKEKVELQQVPSGRQKDKIIGDQAFLNAINKFKRDNFSTVNVPLVNSGFMVDIVGTGAVDLNQLYTVVDENTLLVDYELEKMRVIMRAVVDTQPKINPNDLRNMIHFADYQMMAYAHVAATLREVELISTCTECGKDFHIRANAKNLLLNMPELREKMLKIRQASTIRENSLMSSNLEVSTTDGFRIILGHPSYGEYVLYLTELKAIIARLDAGQAARIRSMSTDLPYVRGIQMPNGVHANNLYQRYLAITMLSDTAEHEMTTEIAKMRKAILTPKYGVRRVKCPHCGKINTDITYDNLEDLLFFHFMVTRWMKDTEQSSENG